MRIAYYNPTLNEPRGAGIHGRALLASWRGQGHEVLCLPWPLVEDPAQRTSRANRAPWLPEPVRTAAMDLRARLQVLSYLADVREQLRAFRPRLLVARRNLYDYLLDELLAEPVPCLGEVNAILSLEFAKLNGRRLLPWEQRREARFLRACDALVCVTDEVRKDVLDLGRPGDRVVTIQNGVDLAAFSPSVAPDPGLAAWAQDFSVVFAYCGTLSPWHDVDTLARAAGLVAGSLPSAGFLFVGPSAAEVEDLLRGSVPPSHVRATGPVPHESVASALAAADVFWAAFEHDYGSPLKMFEYLAMGRPVLLACVGPPAEVVLQAEAGRVVGRGDAAGLAQVAIQTAAELDGVAATQGKKGRRWAERNASWDSVAARMVDIATEHILS